MDSGWDITKIQEFLPQRYPFLFIDKVSEANEEEAKVVCIKNVSINEYFFQGHFPGNPVLPGVIIIEAMAQASIILFGLLKPQIAKSRPDYYLGKVVARFSGAVLPGNQIVLTVRKEKILDNGGMVKVAANVENRRVAEAELCFSVKLKNE
ncbi:3-hydroxyacyl-ACP dehydratase FabZ [Candidatus Omnitrophota bacterium]